MLKAIFTNIEKEIIALVEQHCPDQLLISSPWISSEAIIDAASVRDSKLLLNDYGKIHKGSCDYDIAFVRILVESFTELFIYTSESHMLHSKFIVFVKDEKPFAVLTGSYNYTVQAAKNYENVIFIVDDTIAWQYANEFKKISASPAVKKVMKA